MALPAGLASRSKDRSSAAGTAISTLGHWIHEALLQLEHPGKVHFPGRPLMVLAVQHVQTVALCSLICEKDACCKQQPAHQALV